MPCDTVAIASIKLGAVDPALLKLAMDGLEYGDWRLNGDKLVIRGKRASDALTASVKRAYSKQVVLSQAKRFGWAVKENAEGQLLIQKARL